MRARPTASSSWHRPCPRGRAPGGGQLGPAHTGIHAPPLAPSTDAAGHWEASLAPGPACTSGGGGGWSRRPYRRGARGRRQRIVRGGLSIVGSRLHGSNDGGSEEER
ncbi:hypothetical protein BS78_02G366400 [Paspalum vaginatum]|nr:hypothetical protein BS78_02G366400 [Paspalum vaginatum]